MNKPMLTNEAVSRYQCVECAAGNYCNFNCVEHRTCSMRCPSCTARIWFQGDWREMPKTFTCPRCGETVKKKH